MIVGLGSDIVGIERIAAVAKRHGGHFLERVFTPAELAEAEGRGAAAPAYYAGRWAVKEALSKALGTGIGESCSWLDVETLNQSSGRPETRLSGAAAQTAAALGAERVHVSVSHERQHAVATVILEKL